MNNKIIKFNYLPVALFTIIGQKLKNLYHLKSKLTRIVLLVGIASFLSASLAIAGTKTWTGSVSTNWNTSGNWSGGVPSSGDDVNIPGGLIRYPIISGTAECSKISLNSSSTGALLTIQTGGYLTTSDKVAIEVGGSFIMSGGTLLVDGINCYGTQTGGTILGDDNIKIMDDGVLNQSSGTPIA